MKVVIYLAGPMMDCSHSEMKDWRTEVKKHYEDSQVEILDPVDHVDYKMEEAVRSDKRCICKADVVLVNMWKMSIGTSMEIMWAYVLNKKIITIAPSELKDNYWLKYHSNFIVSNLENAYNCITNGA